MISRRLDRSSGFGMSVRRSDSDTYRGVLVCRTADGLRRGFGSGHRHTQIQIKHIRRNYREQSSRDQGQAHLPAEQPSPRADPRVPHPDAHSRRSRHRGRTQAQGPVSAVGLIRGRRHASRGRAARRSRAFRHGGTTRSEDRHP